MGKFKESAVFRSGFLSNCLKKHLTSYALAALLMALTFTQPASAEETRAKIIGTIVPAGTPLGVVADPLRGTLYSTTNSSTGGLVSVIDEATNTITATIPVGTYPYAITVDPIHYMVWVTNYLSASVSAIDERTNTVIATLPTGSTPHDITVDPFRGTVYVANDGGRSVTIIDEATLTVTTTVTVPNNLNSVGIGVDPVRGLVGVEAFSSGFASSYLLVLDERTNKFIDTITLTTSGKGAPERLAVDPIIGLAYVPQYYTGMVQIIDERDGEIKKSIISTTLTDLSYGGPGTGSLAVDLVKRTLYVVNENVATVSVIDPLKGFVTQTITIPNASDELSGIALDPIRGLAYVTNYNNNSISVISTGKGAACKDLQNFPLLPLLCKTSLYNSKPGEDRPSWPWAAASEFH